MAIATVHTTGINWDQVLTMLGSVLATTSALAVFVTRVTRHAGTYIQREVHSVTDALAAAVSGIDRRTQMMSIAGAVVATGFGLFAALVLMRRRGETPP